MMQSRPEAGEARSAGSADDDHGLSRRATIGLIAATATGGLAEAARAQAPSDRPAPPASSGYASLRDRGGVGDGSRDDLPAFRAAVADHRRLVIPAGTYRLALPDGIGLAPPRDARWRGDGPEATILRFEPTSADYRTLLAMAAEGGLRLEDLTLDLRGFPGSDVVMIVARSGLECRNVWFRGGTTDRGGQVSHRAHGIILPNEGVQEDIHFENCEFSRFTNPLLKTNESRSVQRRLTLSRCRLFDNYGESWSFNSPMGEGTGIDVIESSFRSHRAHLIGSVYGLHVSLVGARRFRIAGCDFADTIFHAIHLEENCELGEITGNRAAIDGTFLEIVDNDVGGRREMPQHIVISDNVARKIGARRAGAGISLAWDESPASPARKISISHNIMTGFANGFVHSCRPEDAAVLAHNIADDCTNGYAITHASGLIDSNVSRSCEYPISSAYGGIVRNHVLIDCEKAAVATYAPLVLQDLSVIVPEFAIGARETIHRTLCPLNRPEAPLGSQTLVSGHAVTSVACEAIPDHAERRDQVEWNGRALARTPVATNVHGGLAPDIVAHEGTLAVALFSASPRSRVRLLVEFRGMMTIGSQRTA